MASFWLVPVFGLRLGWHVCVVGCGDPTQPHIAQFIVCRRCHRVAEIDDPTINALLTERSREIGFRIEPSSLELKGLCSDCETAGS